MLRAMIVLTAVVMVAAAAFAQAQFDDTPAGEREWGFRPADGSASATNPPGFCWRPQEGARVYALEVARDRDFRDIVYEAQGLELSVHCPPLTLPAERLWWRVAFVGEENRRSQWSKPRSFTFAEDAVRFPMPQRGELLVRVPDEHPRLFVRPDELPRLRELAQGQLRDRYQSLVAACEEIMADPPPTEEPPKYPEDMVRGSDEWRSIWWGNRTYTIRVLNSAATLAFTRLLGGQEEYGQKARELLMAAAGWDPKGATGYRYNDEAGMPYNYYFSRTYTFVNDLLNEEERQRCREVMRVRGEEMYNHLCPRHLWRPYSSHSNRAWHFLGEVAIAFLDEIPEAADWLWFAENVFFNVYPVWSDDDGGWHEGSAYWASYLTCFTWWQDVQRVVLGIDGYRKPFFSACGGFALYVMPPNVPRGGFGDLTGGREAQDNRTLMSVFAAQAQQPYWQDYVERIGGPSQTGGYIGFIRGALPDVESRPISELPSSKLFRGTGLALLHTDITDARRDVQIEFKSSPFGSQSHGYEAQNAFLLYAYGDPLLIRTGRRDSYGSKHHKQWMWSTRSVNSITVGGQGQMPHSAAAEGRIVAFETSESFDYVAGEAGSAYPDGLVEQFTRHILFVKPHLVVIFDELATPQPQTFQYWLHSPEQMQIGGQHDIRLVVGDAGCRIDMLEPEGLALSQTDQFDPPPRPRITLTQWHMTAETPQPASRQHFATVIRPHRAGEQPPTAASVQRSESCHAIRAALPEGEVIILWRTGGGELSAMDVSTDADVAAVKLDANGAVVEGWLHGGEALAYRGEDVLR
ncbi:MAG: DUF4962 domain-containing protein [Armatimonadota bacterium]|nr:DUF4962 domain-containing protein [Armatimonadota bacterium]